jgi:hypothetical protein
MRAPLDRHADPGGSRVADDEQAQRRPVAGCSVARADGFCEARRHAPDMAALQQQEWAEGRGGEVISHAFFL